MNLLEEFGVESEELEERSEFEKDGSSGGDLFFSDFKSCKKFNDEFEFSEYIDWFYLKYSKTFFVKYCVKYYILDE